MKFTMDDQMAFAKLSQDFNPMHCDSILARRFIFGEPVVHGINAMILAIKNATKKYDLPFEIHHLTCKFKRPLYLEKELDINVFASVTSPFEDLRIDIFQMGMLALRMKLKLQFLSSACKLKSKPSAAIDTHTDARPENIAFSELKSISKVLQCSLNLELAKQVYSEPLIKPSIFCQSKCCRQASAKRSNSCSCWLW